MIPFRCLFRIGCPGLLKTYYFITLRGFTLSEVHSYIEGLEVDKGFRIVLREQAG